MERLAGRLKSTESKSQFISFGFSWKGDEAVFGDGSPAEQKTGAEEKKEKAEG
jgi:hypothetical protein